MGRIRDVVLDWATDGPRMALAHFLAPEIRAKSIQTTQSLQYGVEQWTDWNTKKAVLEGYESHFLVYRLTKFRADAFRAMDLVAKDINTGEQVADTHPAAKMIANPNPRIPMDELEFRAELFLCMAGDAYWYINKVGDSVRLDPLRSDRVSIKAYKDKLIYLYTIPGETPVPFEEEEIVHFKNYSPSDDLFGQPVLRANAKLVDTGNAITDFQYHSMKNGMWPSGVLNTAKMTDQQYKRLQAQLKAFKEGPANARKTLVLEDGRGYVPSTPTPSEMDFMGGTNLTNQEICVGFGVYAEAIGLVPAKYENMRQSLRATWENTLIPEKDMFEGILNTQLAPHFDGIYFEYDLSQTIPVIEARKENAQEGKMYFDMGISTKAINERLNLGYDEADCPDEGYLPVTLLPVGTERIQEEERRIGAIEVRGAAADLHYRATDRKKLGWERKVASTTSKLFNKQGKAVEKAVRNGSKNVEGVIDSFDDDWTRMLTVEYRAIIDDFGQATYDALTKRAANVNTENAINTSVDKREFDPWPEEVQKYVNTRVAEEIDYIQSTTKDAVKRVVGSGIADGESLVTISKSIRDVFNTWESGTGTYRSMMIARTEVHAASGYAMHESARQSGVAQEKAWLDAGDDRVRPAHISNTAQGWIRFDDSYQNGAMFPGDGTDDINCRCVEIYRDR